MKSLRLWLLIVLAVLIPVRSAMAAAMLCPVSESGVQIELPVKTGFASHHAMDDVMDDASHHGDASAHHDHGGSDHHDHGAASDKCNLCSAFCSMTPLLGGTLRLSEPLETVATVFPDLAAPPPSFLSDGQERPPRSI